MGLLKFKTLIAARAAQKKMKVAYGYRPALFSYVGLRRKKPFAIVKPSGLRKI